MTLFASYTREQLRQTYAEAWRKHLINAPLTPLEALIAGVVELHPEYHALVADSAGALAFAADPAGERENPFLHMGLHVAVREQIAIDRPPGVRELQRLLLARFGGVHQAEHELVQALGETLWNAQRSGHAPDEDQYLRLGRSRLARAPDRS